jgi:NADH-quinone oxidoreductase subunit F
MAERRLLTEFLHVPGIERLDIYRAHGGYRALAKALTTMAPEDVVREVEISGLRGRGGAGFPTARKWSFLPDDGRPRVLVCNADEGEPGTFKDHLILHRLPHLLLEGIVLSAYAIRAARAFVYLRGEFLQAYEVLSDAIAEARAGGYLGKDILGSGFSLEVQLYRGAGAYICGEETALLDSLEGRRGIPRMKPPFPATSGLYGLPTVVNNVETLATVPVVVAMGGEAYRGLGTPKSPGTRLFAVSGQVQRPGVYELELGTPLRELVFDLAGGPLPGRTVRCVIPGGSSVPLLTADKLDTPLDFEAVARAGSLLGSGGVVVLDDSTCMVHAARILVRFYRHESCGKCTPCREGTNWLHQVLTRFDEGGGTEQDLDLALDLADNMVGKCFCPLGDAAVQFLASAVLAFREEFVAHVRQGACPHGYDHRPSLVAQVY